MFKTARIVMLVLALACLAPASIVMAQANAIDAKRVKATCEKVALTYVVGTNDGRRFELAANSRLQWSKNTDEDVYGNVFIWTDRGVPAAVASIFQFVRNKDDLDSEFHSLSVKPIRATVGDKIVWEPSIGGITYRTLEGAPPVPESTLRRRTQMNIIARQFTARREFPADNVTRLRLLPRPIFEYDNEELGVLSGAIYAFVDQTDPEVWLIIEAHADNNGDRSWRYALARMNSRTLMVSRDDQEVFRAEMYEQWGDPMSPYVLFQRLQDQPGFQKLR